MGRQAAGVTAALLPLAMDDDNRNGEISFINGLNMLVMGEKKKIPFPCLFLRHILLDGLLINVDDMFLGVGCLFLMQKILLDRLFLINVDDMLRGR